jgi:hypothetical protein
MKAGTIITADMLGSSKYVGKLASRLPVREINKLTPKYRNVLIRDLIVESGGQFVNMRGIPESPFTNLQVVNADVNCRSLINLSDARNFTFENVDIQNQGSTISLLSVSGLKFDNVSFKSQVEVKINDGSKSPKEILTENIRFINCTPQKPKGWQETTYKPRDDVSIKFQITGNRVTKSFTGSDEYIYYGLNGRVIGDIRETSRRSAFSSLNIVIMKNKNGQSNRIILLQP